MIRVAEHLRFSLKLKTYITYKLGRFFENGFTGMCRSLFSIEWYQNLKIDKMRVTFFFLVTAEFSTDVTYATNVRQVYEKIC